MKGYMHIDQGFTCDETFKNDVIRKGLYTEDDFYEIERDEITGEEIAMGKAELSQKDRVFLGYTTIFEVTNMETGEKRIEELDRTNILDLVIGCNTERMSDLTTLYNRDDVVVDGELYRVLVGYKLIADLIVLVAEWMYESIEFREEEYWNEYLKEKQNESNQ